MKANSKYQYKHQHFINNTKITPFRSTHCRVARLWPTAQISSRSEPAPHWMSSLHPAEAQCCPVDIRKEEMKLSCKIHVQTPR